MMDSSSRRRFMKAVAATPILGDLFSRLKRSGSFEIEPMPNGSNLFRLVVKGTDPERFRETLAEKGILLSPYSRERGGFLVAVNATLNRSDAETLAGKFEAAL